MVRSDCYNGRDYERVIAVENCACDKSDFQCDFGFKQDDSWSTGKYSNKNVLRTVDKYASPFQLIPTDVVLF